MNISELPDEDLAIYVREVDHEAYREVVSRFEIPLLRYTQTMLPNELQARETIQQAFIDAYIHINSFNPRIGFSNFMYRFAHNAIKSHLKNKKNDFGTYENLTEEFMGEDDMESEFADKAFLEHIKSNLHKLPIKFKEALALHFIARKSYDDISQILQIPVSSVSTRVGLGKNLIKSYAKKG